MGGSGLVALPSDLLKFGYLLSHDGNIDGTQLVSASYIKTATSHLSDTRITAPLPSEACGYGYQIWRSEKMVLSATAWVVSSSITFRIMICSLSLPQTHRDLRVEIN